MDRQKRQEERGLGGLEEMPQSSDEDEGNASKQDNINGIEKDGRRNMKEDKLLKDATAWIISTCTKVGCSHILALEKGAWCGWECRWIQGGAIVGIHNP